MFGFRDLLPVCLKTELFKNCQYVHKKQRSSAIYLHILSRTLFFSSVPQSRLEWLHLDGKFLRKKLCRASLDFNFRGDLELQSWTKVWGQICNCGAFFNSYMPNPFPHPTPTPTPQTTVDACIHNCSRVSTFHRVGGGRTASNFRKRMHCFIRAPRNLKKINTVLLSRTFVEDCT